MVLPLSLPRRRYWSSTTMVVGLGGWLVLVGGAEVVLLSSAGLLPVEAMQKRRGAGYCHGHVCAAGMVLNRAKAFIDASSVDMVAAPLCRRFPAGGTMAKHHVLCIAGLSG